MLQLEKIISLQMKRMGVYRADISSGKSWTLHPPDHGPIFCQNLPKLIDMIERGEYPQENAGKYDLNLEAFLSAVNKGQADYGSR